MEKNNNRNMRETTQQLPPFPNQGQLYMNQQNENLEYMYDVLNQLRQQIHENLRIKNTILDEVDNLSIKLDRDPTKRIENTHKDILLFDAFLNRKLENKVEISETADDKEHDKTFLLKEQNKKLNRLLEKKKQMVAASVHTLHHHERCLSNVIGLLRQDIMEYQTSTLQEIKKLFMESLDNEQKEFKEYLKGANDLQEVFDIIKLYKKIDYMLEN